MPIYEYECEKCQEHHEVQQKFSDPLLEKCPSCGGKVKKLMSLTSFSLKGSGWYSSGYASAPVSDKSPKPAETAPAPKAPAAASPAPAPVASPSKPKKSD